ncbi:hypothetical protein QMO56_08230 [Roseomonas sp. E05]|uniref:hypothetical protein n=1 Tax=Roseomonas sp. E05 TaxID=3046310 RepID=UPI0024B9CF7F|nr:hypothetical protein [Roseomonas sp. E05]MDJ0388099.1 hypothetical protein [Roseomonas sp. E05]
MLIYNRKHADLWTLLAPPAIWATHFMVCYVAAAIACAKAADIFASLHVLRIIILLVTLLALALIVTAGLQARRHWGFGTDDPPYEQPTAEVRQHFLGYATLLLSGLSFVSVIFVALPALTIADCR